MKHFLFIALIVIVTLFANDVSNALAQDIFGTDQPAAQPAANPAAPAAAQPNANAANANPRAAVAAPDAKPLSPAAAAILATKPTTPAQYLRAIDILSQLNEKEIAAKLLADFVATNPTDDALLEAVDKLQSDTLLRLSRQEFLKPSIDSIVDRAMQLSKARNENQERIAKLVQDLIAAQTDNEQNKALAQLLPAGDVAVAAIIAEFANENLTPANLGRLQTTLQQIGSPATAPIVAALETDNIAQRIQLFEYLGHTRSPRSAIWLFAPAIADNEPAEIKASARKNLERLLGSVPHKSAVIASLHKELKEYLSYQARFNASADDQVPSWKWDGAKKTSVKQLVPQAAAQSIHAARLANDLLLLDPKNLEIQKSWLVSHARVAAWDAGLDKLPAFSEKDLTQIKKWDARTLDESLESALKERDTVAITSLSHLTGLLAEHFLQNKEANRSQPPTSLGSALRSSDRRTQFAAAQAIMNFEPAISFAGAGDFSETLLYLARSTGQRRALVVFPNAETATKLAGNLNALGIAADVATNGRNAILMAQQNPDYEFIMLSTRVDRTPVSLAYQELRRDYRTARTPIIIMTEDITDELKFSHLADRDTLTIYFGRPLEDTAVKIAVDRIFAKIGSAAITIPERVEHGRFALAAMAKCTEWNSKQYDYRAQVPLIAGAMENPNLCATAAHLLGRLATHPAQKALVDYASRSEVPLELRKIAAAELGESIRKFGLLLTKVEIVQQYDRYNASESSERSTQLLLGAVLDAIEWPSKNK